MAIIIEDGTGREDSTALAGAAAMEAYFSARGRSLDGHDEAAREAALVRATDHMERRFSHWWKGARASADQALSWPRVGVSLPDGTAIADDAVPVQVQRACFEYARLALERDELAPVPVETAADSTGRVVRKRVRQVIGPVEEETDEEYERIPERTQAAHAYGDRRPASLAVSTAAIPEYPQAEMYLDGLLRAVDSRDGGPAPVDACAGRARYDPDWPDAFVNAGISSIPWTGD